MLMAFFIPVNVFASEVEPEYAAGWQYVGGESRYMNANQNYRTKGYYAVDGGNFKIEILSNRSSGTFAASMYVNGAYSGVSSATGISNGRGVIEFSGLNPNDLLYFDVLSYYSATIELRMYD